MNVLDLGPAAAQRLAGALGLLLLALTVGLTARKTARETPYGTALAWALIAVTLLLVAPLTRKAHCVLLLIPAAALVSSIQLDRHGGVTRTLAWAALLTLFCLGVFTASDFFRLFAPSVAAAKAWSNYFHAIGCLTFAMLVVYAAVFLALWSHVEEAQPGRWPATIKRKA